MDGYGLLCNPTVYEIVKESETKITKDNHKQIIIKMLGEYDMWFFTEKIIVQDYHGWVEYYCKFKSSVDSFDGITLRKFRSKCLTDYCCLHHYEQYAKIHYWKTVGELRSAIEKCRMEYYSKTGK